MPVEQLHLSAAWSRFEFSDGEEPAWAFRARGLRPAERDELLAFFRASPAPRGFDFALAPNDVRRFTVDTTRLRFSERPDGRLDAAFVLVRAWLPHEVTANFVPFRSSAIPSPLGGLEIVDYPAGEPRYPVFFFRAGYGLVRATVQFDRACAEPFRLAWDASGSAVEGRDYIMLNPRVLPVPAGTREAAIRWNVASTGDYTGEVRLNVHLDRGPSDCMIDDERKELRSWIRSLAPPPVLGFALDTSNAETGDHDVEVRVNGSSRGLVTPLLRVDGRSTAIPGVDFELLPHPGFDTSTGEALTQVQVRVLPTVTAGRVLALALDNELEDGSQRNFWTRTDSFQLDSLGEPDLFPADPSDHATGPGSIIPPTPIQVEFDPVLTSPDGRPVSVVTQLAGANGAGYLRKNSESQLHAAGPVTLHPQQRWTRFSFYVRRATDHALPRFVRVQWRDRGFQVAPPQAPPAGLPSPTDVNHAVIFDTQRAGDPRALAYEGDHWAAHIELNMGPDGGWDGALETHTWPDGRQEELLRLWIYYREGENARLGDACNILVYPAFYGVHADPSETQHTNAGKGIAMFWPLHEVSDSRLAGPPPRFRPRVGMAWLPEGNATTLVSPVHPLHRVTLQP